MGTVPPESERDGCPSALQAITAVQVVLLVARLIVEGARHYMCLMCADWCSGERWTRA